MHDLRYPVVQKVFMQLAIMKINGHTDRQGKTVANNGQRKISLQGPLEECFPVISSRRKVVRKIKFMM
jgi:hypothetical protein